MGNNRCSLPYWMLVLLAPMAPIFIIAMLVKVIIPLCFKRTRPLEHSDCDHEFYRPDILCTTDCNFFYRSAPCTDRFMNLSPIDTGMRSGEPLVAYY